MFRAMAIMIGGGRGTVPAVKEIANQRHLLRKLWEEEEWPRHIHNMRRVCAPLPPRKKPEKEGDVPVTVIEPAATMKFEKIAFKMDVGRLLWF